MDYSTTTLTQEQYWVIWCGLQVARYRVQCELATPALSHIHSYIEADLAKIEAGFRTIDTIRAPLSPAWCAVANSLEGQK